MPNANALRDRGISRSQTALGHIVDSGRFKDDAQVGELGTILHADGHTMSTELSIGVNIGGKERVIPLLVKGNERIADAMRKGTFTGAMIDKKVSGIAVARYLARVKAGAVAAPGFDSIEEAQRFKNAKAGTIKRGYQ